MNDQQGAIAVPTKCDICGCPYSSFPASGVCPSCGDAPGPDRNRRLRLDSITCMSCGFARAIVWGTPEALAFFHEAYYFHFLEEPDHHITYPGDFKPGMTLLSELERRVGAAYKRGTRDGTAAALKGVVEYVNEHMPKMPKG